MHNVVYLLEYFKYTIIKAIQTSVKTYNARKLAKNLITIGKNELNISELFINQKNVYADLCNRIDVIQAVLEKLIRSPKEAYAIFSSLNVPNFKVLMLDFRSKQTLVLNFVEENRVLELNGYLAAAKEKLTSSELALGLHSANNSLVTPLILAVMLQNESCVKLLLEAGAFVNEIDANEGSPLHYAAKRNNVTLCKILVQYGASICSSNFQEKTPLHLAIENYCSESVSFLIELTQDEYQLELALSLATRLCYASAMKPLKQKMANLLPNNGVCA